MISIMSNNYKMLGCPNRLKVKAHQITTHNISGSIQAVDVSCISYHIVCLYLHYQLYNKGINTLKNIFVQSNIHVTASLKVKK